MQQASRAQSKRNLLIHFSAYHEITEMGVKGEAGETVHQSIWPHTGAGEKLLPLNKQLQR
jgi:hypothetical protein